MITLVVIGVPLALAAATTASLPVTAVLFGLSGVALASLPASTQLLLVGASPILAGILGAVALRRVRNRPDGG